MRSTTQWGIAEARSSAYPTLKRLLDIAISSVLLLALLPVLVLLALAIVLDSPGPVLFRQQRVGEQGRLFDMLKFRSMYVGVDPSPHQKYIVAYIKGQAELQESAEGRALYKLADDRRVTRLGRWLRETSLDELPQLWNVLRGEMSLVGPRPPLPYETELYQPAHMQRLAVRPGITGLWQVSGRSRTTFEEMVAMDCEYIQSQSFALDLFILLRTIPVVLGKEAR
jgi:lipopolysaccharide/colanic/teichoic acid biosynthesis glycosyltransferase